MATIKQDIIAFAEGHPGFESREAIDHLKKVRKKVNPANVATMLREMTEGTKPDLVRKQVPDHPRELYRYWRSGHVL